MAKYKAKTVVNEKSVDAFLAKVEPESKRDDCHVIVKMMEETSKEPAKMWGTAIVGCGEVHYEYDSGHSGDMPVVGFSPRKTSIVLYMGDVAKDFPDDVQKLGKVKTSVGCVYLKKLDDVDIKVLKSLMRKTIDRVRSQKKFVSLQKKK